MKGLYVSRYPLMREAARVYKAGGEEGLTSWVASLSFDDKYRLASQIITILARETGRDPADVALEVLKGKGEKL